MQPFCSSHRAVAVDIEGMGQSFWPTVSQDIPTGGDARGFMGKLQLTLLEKLGRYILWFFLVEFLHFKLVLLIFCF